jgi:hypothetical protein
VPLRKEDFLRATQLVIVPIFLLCAALPAFGQKPDFCEKVEDSALSNLEAPYSKHSNPQGQPYCEGLLPNAIAALPPTVISIKQIQAAVAPVTAGKVVTLTWCDDPNPEPVHVSLRSIVIPLYSLDAQQRGSFTWKSNMMATWQPEWGKVAAEADRKVAMAGQTYQAMVPLRMGPGYANTYSFIIRSEAVVHLTKALIKPIAPVGPSKLLDVSLTKGPSSDTWIALVGFGGFSAGIYQVTFAQAADGTGSISVPIYLFHGACKVHE